MPTQEVKARVKAFKAKHGRDPTQSERDKIQQESYKKVNMRIKPKY